MKAKAETEKSATAAGAFTGEKVEERIDSKKGLKDTLEHVMKAIFLVCGLVAIGFVLVITVYLIVSGIPAIREVGLWNFLSGTEWHPNYKTDPAYGCLLYTSRCV